MVVVVVVAFGSVVVVVVAFGSVVVVVVVDVDVVVVVVVVVVLPGTADHVKPLASALLAVKVTSVFQLSETAPWVSAHTMPASHTPVVPPVYSSWARLTEPPSVATSGPHSKSFGIWMIWPVLTAVLTGP